VQGLWLAPVTLIFAAALPVLLFSQPYSDKLLPAGSITRPPFFVDLSDERSFYYFLLGTALLVVIGAIAFRRSRAGRNVVALRDNEPAALAAGIDPLRSRIVALAIAGGIAGLAGVLFAVSEEGVSAAQFAPELSLNVFVMLILGGMGGVSGAVIGAVFGAGILTGPQQLAQFAPLITGVGALMILLLLPGGLSQAVFAVRDSVLRLVAARRHLDVPSLTGAAEPEPGKRRWRLAPPARGGLGALPGGRRYSLPSFLWGKSET
jgi:branched-chain amino acid transport system permease protein